MNESKKRALTLTPNSGLQAMPDKKRMLNGSPQRLARSSTSSGESIDWRRQFLVQKSELNRIKKLNDYLELERNFSKEERR